MELPLSAIALPEARSKSRIARELAALALLGFAGFAAASLFSLDVERRPNLGGPAGEALAQALVQALGNPASYALLALAALVGSRAWLGAGWKVVGREVFGGAMVVTAVATGSGLWSAEDVAASGLFGAFLATSLETSFNIAGGYIAVAFALICGTVLLLNRAPTELAAATMQRLKMRRLFGRRGAHGVQDRGDGAGSEIPSEPTDDAKGSVAWSGPSLRVRRLETRDAWRERMSDSRVRSKGAYQLPQLALLDVPPAEHALMDEAVLEKSARILEQKLADFGINGAVVEVQPGPVVTMYKFEPGSGIKVSQIVNLADDLSMALKAAAVRIQAPVPGEAVVGIEVPNRRRELVYLREILESPEFGNAQSQLTIALGKDIAGRPMAADLARMPHLLIAGATGTGKSVSLHTMIASILFNATADDVRFILIDPKMLELSVYENIPHLLVPVVVDPEKAACALLWATQEMENRYLVMRDLGVRNLDGYNRVVASRAPAVELKPSQQVSAGAEPPAPPKIEHKKLPKIVIVIDELADLLLSQGKTVERDITRLAQKARAAGIHLVLATQRPSVDVITGLIKANLPARISFQVTSRVDSRTILDSIGAERLLGAGDMLFMPPGSAKLVRLHGPLVSESEIRKVTDFLRAQGAPEYRMEILETKPASEEDGEAAGEKDEMYDDAVRIVMESGQASISMIQRRLRVGYNRAARMVEQMEREGLVMPTDGVRPREVRLLRSVR